jgi:hypothetical protein
MKNGRAWIATLGLSAIGSITGCGSADMKSTAATGMMGDSMKEEKMMEEEKMSGNMMSEDKMMGDEKMMTDGKMTDDKMMSGEKK